MKTEQDICEARVAGRWEILSIHDVLELATRPGLRCVECHGPVRAHREANNGMRAHFEHLVRHDGCSRGTRFNGKKAIHPDALS